MNISTIIRSYYFNTEKPEELEAYLELRKSFSSQGIECFETRGGSLITLRIICPPGRMRREQTA